MKLEPGFDPSENKIVLNLETGLIDKYFPNLVGLFKDLEDIEVEQIGNSRAVISYPLGDKDRKTSSGVAVDGRKMHEVHKVIGEFINGALRKELKTTEFIPLKNYPVPDLMSDIKLAVRAKRNLCIIGDYEEYLRMEKERKYQFHQVMVDHGTNEWNDAVLMILQGEEGLEELRKTYEPKLSYVEWF